MRKKRYLYSENGITFHEAADKAIADLVLRGILNLDSSVQDTDTQKWHKIRDIETLTDLILKPDVQLKFNEPNIDTYLSSGVISYFYNVPRRTFILMMLFAPYFLFYWLWMQWSYYDQRDKSKRSRSNFIARLLNVIFFRSLMYIIASDKDMMQTKRATFDPSLTGCYMYGIILAPVILGFVFRSWWWISYPLGAVASVAMVLVLLPVRDYIQAVNDEKGCGFTPPSLLFYLILLGLFVNIGWLVWQAFANLL
ncbi:MAG: hypothetical protein U1C33_06825 [Candidatus Cloacimonadaceae bacterium]|nr:hypothetical protein [Candidatus Cloacimonadaceae bacterium]